MTPSGPGRRTRARVPPVAVAAIVLAVAGLVVNVWRPLAPDLATATRLDQFSNDLLSAIDAYRAPRLAIGIAARVLAILVPVTVILTPVGRRWVDRIGGRSPRPAGRFVRAVAVAAAVAGVTWLAILPLSVWAGLIHDGQWGLRTASASLWWRDRAISGALDIATTAIVAGGLVAVVRRAPDTWPWHVTWVGTGLTAVFALVWPLAIAPLFLPTEPLEDGPVRTAVEEVLAAADMADAPVLVAAASTRTTRINAVVTGLGPTRRVVLHDTLLERPIPEVRAVLAHELGHRAHRDIARGVLGSALGLLLGAWTLRGAVVRVGRRLWPDGPISAARLAALAVAGIAVLQAVADPVVLWQSRRVEISADHAALVLSDDPAALIGIQRTFTVRDLAAPDPPTWQTVLFSTHPTVGERIRYAAGFAADRQIPLPTVDAYEREERAAPRPWSRPG